MKKILVIDNYDSFVHNAVQLLRESSEPVNITIQLNDRIDFEKFGDYDGILLSPGPGIPEEAGDLMAAIGQIVRQRIPVLGICPDSMPEELIASSHDEAGHIMSFYHRNLPIHGVQFHPESCISNCGPALIRNWLATC